ncbi:ricin B-like lectin R40G3 isoform X4 [Rhodamnia argentea]|uniref:Ricin B-like lectin R40G3 isoform X4 n=1 Tax=Rhodamnia argentea TaxID=178133 RepID=A0A8B8NA90_9MYRT|nr:ricin B-like lectin R40G3 isoform X4 [Rhodamnia argentea]
MEYPYGHPTHSHHRRDDDDGEHRRNRPYPPPGSALPTDAYGQPPPPRPPFYGGGDDFTPPSPPPSNVYHTSHSPAPPRPPFYGCGGDFVPPLPPPSNVYHTSHSPAPSAYHPPRDDFASGYSSPYPPPPQKFYQGSTEYSDYPPSATVEHVAHGVGGGAVGSYFAHKPTYKVYCKAEPNYSLTIRDSKVILAPSDSSDPYQKWYKDEKFSTRVKDEEGCPCFSLVNKATGEAIKHSAGASHPVQLVPYKPEQLDASVLWTESKDLGHGYRTVRMVNNVRLNLDAFHGDKKSGGVRDGTTIVLWQWNHGDNQLWKVTPY